MKYIYRVYIFFFGGGGGGGMMVRVSGGSGLYGVSERGVGI